MVVIAVPEHPSSRAFFIALAVVGSVDNFYQLETNV
jgi:hypothetical protein